MMPQRPLKWGRTAEKHSHCNEEENTMTTSVVRIRQMTYIALCAALMAICSWISIPTSIPFTLQTFGVCVAVGLLGTRGGFLSVLVYILLGAVGMPVFAGFQGGPGVLLGATGGYIIGFLFTALAVGGILKRFGRSVPVMAAAMAAGIALCYGFGTVWFMYVYASASGPIGLMSALSWCVIPYILPDCCKIALAVVLVKRLEGQVAL